MSLDRIIDQAWRLVDREGLEGLSTRKLAAELNAKGPALYWHIKNKRQLMSLMIEQALFGTVSSPRNDIPWWEWLPAVGHQQRTILLSHRDSGLIASRAAPTERMRDEIFEKAVGTLIQAGFDRADAAAAWGGLARIVLGSVIYEQNEDTRAFAQSFGDTEASFSFALDAYILGLRHMRPLE